MRLQPRQASSSFGGLGECHGQKVDGLRLHDEGHPAGSLQADAVLEARYVSIFTCVPIDFWVHNRAGIYRRYIVI